MNISQIQAALHDAFAKGQEYADLQRSSSSAASHRCREFGQSVTNLDDLAKPIAWAEAERIADVDDVDNTLRDFIEDSTRDGAVILVQRIIAAYLKGQ